MPAANIDRADDSPATRRPRGDDADAGARADERERARRCARPCWSGNARAEDAHREDDDAVEQEDAPADTSTVWSTYNGISGANAGERHQPEEQHDAGSDRGRVPQPAFARRAACSRGTSCVNRPSDGGDERERGRHDRT